MPAEVLDAPGRLVITPHPVLLDGQRNIVADLRPGESLADFLARHVPSIDSGAWSASIGGMDVPCAMWRHTFPRHGQLISCRASVHKSALKFIALGAVAVMSFGVPLLIAGAGVGAALIAKALKPKIPTTPTAEAGREVYSLRSQRNTARAYAPIGTLLGELRVTPDLASQPYTWFEGDDQYLSTILLGGINVDSYTDLAVGDTPLSSYSDVTVYNNGFSGMTSQDVPLYSNADSIAGATLEDSTAWVTRTSSTGTVMLQLDFEYQLYNQRGEGEPTLSIAAEYRAVGASTWLSLNAATYRNKTTEIRRVTWTKAVALGQYEVRARRTNGVNEADVTRSVQWVTLRSIQPDDADYSAFGRVGIRIKATGQLNGSLDTVRATFKPRPLPVWNGSAWVNATTRPGVSNPGALILQVLRGIWHEGVLQFGYGLSDDQIDIEGLKGFILYCTANGFTYDRWITESISLGNLLDEIALAGLGQFMWLDGSRPTVMWAADDQPLGGVVNMANMARGSFSVSYDLAEAADGIEFQYVDRARDFETATLRVMAPGATTMLKPARITGQGVTSEAHAAVLARYHLAQNLYQYKEISFGADLERLDYRRMSMLSLSHDMTQWGYGGRLISAATAGSNVVLTLDEPVPSLPSRFVGLRIPGERDYRVFSVQAFSGTSDTITITGPWPSGVALPGDSAANPAHDTLWCYDVKATPGYRVRVTDIEPDSDLKGATIRVVPEGDEFWDYVLTGTYVPAPNESLIPELDAPTVLNIRVHSQTNRQGDTEWVQLNVVWDSTGDMGHAQVWAAIDGQPLRMVDGQALGNRSSFRIDENGDWLIQVRPFDSNGKGGDPASVLFAADAINRPPVNVDVFEVDEVAGGLRRYRFGYSGTSPGAYAGVRIRYRAGSTPIVAADWDSLTPLGTATDIYTQATESTLPAAGTWTFAARSISTAGVLSSSVRSVTVTLGGTFTDILDPDYTPAPTPTGASVTAGFSKLIIEHDTPSYTQGHGHGLTRVYGVLYAGGAEPVISSATVLGEFTSDIGRVPVELGQVWRIWVKWVTVDGVESATAAGGSGTDGIAVTVGKVGASDLGNAVVLSQNLAPASVTADKALLDIGGSNLVGNNSFEVDSNGDGIADGWGLYDGTGGGSVSRVAGRISGFAQRFTTTAAVDTWPRGISGGAGLIWQPNHTYVLSLYARAPSGSGFLGKTLGPQWNVTPAITELKNPPLATSWQRYAWRLTWGSTVEPGGPLYLSVPYQGTFVGSWDIDDVQVEDGDTLSGYQGKLALNTIVAGDGAISNLAITNALIANAAIDTAKIADASIVTAKIGDAQITNAKIANIDATKITTGLLSAARIDGEGLTIKVGGVTILGAGTALNYANITPAAGWLNSNISVSSGVLTGIGTGGVQVDNSYATIGQNLIPNSDQTSAMTMTGYIQAGTFDQLLQYASNFWSTTYNLLGGTTRNLTAHQSNVAAGGDVAVTYDIYPTGSYGPENAIPVIAGQRYCMSAYMQAHRCYVGVCIQFFYSDNSPASGLINSGPVGTNQGVADALAEYSRPAVFATAPAGAATCRIACRKYNTIAGNTDSYVWLAAPQLEAVAANAASPSPYVAGPAGSTRQLGYAGDLNATYGATWGSNLDGRPSNLAGLTGAEAIKNGDITITIGAGGALSASGGPSVSGAVTLSGLGAGAMAAINQITNANVSTYIAGAAIELAQIKVASITTLAALSSYLGTVEIATGGYLRSGKTSFADTTGGYYLANTSSVPQFHIGDSTAWLKFSTATGFDLNPGTFSIALSGGDITVAVSNGTQSYGGRTVTVTGGKTPYTYTWSAAVYAKDPEGVSASALVSGGQGTATAGISGSANNARIWIYVTVQVEDANGRIKSASYSIQATHGTYIP